MYMGDIKDILFNKWKNINITKKDDYFWPEIDRFCFPQLVASFGPVISEVNTFVKKKGTVLQAGGNCGLYTAEYAKTYKNVYTFEPDMTNMACLVLNTLGYNNIIKFQACLGDAHSMTSLQNPLEIMDVGGIHVKSPTAPPDNLHTVESESNIPIMKIDDIIFHELDLIHLDIEGYELFALKGAVETIKKHKPVIVLEVCDHGKKFGYSIDDVYTFMTSMDYVCIKKLESNNDYVFISE